MFDYRHDLSFFNSTIHNVASLSCFWFLSVRDTSEKHLLNWDFETISSTDLQKGYALKLLIFLSGSLCSQHTLPLLQNSMISVICKCVNGRYSVWFQQSVIAASHYHLAVSVIMRADMFVRSELWYILRCFGSLIIIIVTVHQLFGPPSHTSAPFDILCGFHLSAIEWRSSWSRLIRGRGLPNFQKIYIQYIILVYIYDDDGPSSW